MPDFNKAIDLNPNEAIYYNNRGDCETELFEYKNAINDYTKAITLNPNEGFYYYNRGVCNAKLEYYVESLI